MGRWGWGGALRSRGRGDKFTHVCCIRKATATRCFCVLLLLGSRGLVALENHDVGLAASGARGEHAELLVLVDEPLCRRCHEPASGRLCVTDA